MLSMYIEIKVGQQFFPVKIKKNIQPGNNFLGFVFELIAVFIFNLGVQRR